MRRTGASAVALPATALISCLWLAVACAVGSPASPSVGQTSPTPETVATTGPTPAQTVTSTAFATPTAVATPTPAQIVTTPTPPLASASATPGASPTEALVSPPDGMLGESAPGVSGNHGTYCWTSDSGTSCVDFVDFGTMPDLAELDPSAAGAALTFTTNPSIEFISWQASYAKPGGEFKSLASGGTDYDPDGTATPPPGLTSASFAGPASGTWIVTVSIYLVNGDDASYGWRMNVP